MADEPRLTARAETVRDSPPPAPEERELVHAVLARNRKAAAQLVAAHVDAIYGYVRHRLTPRPDLVDDVVQEVFLAALTHLRSFRGTSPLRGWLLGIARHKVEDVYRQRLRSPESFAEDAAVGEELATDDPRLDERLDSARIRARARHVLAKLPEHYAVALLWRYWEQRNTREIAAATGATEKSVERTLARARARFRQLWLEE